MNYIEISIGKPKGERMEFELQLEKIHIYICAIFKDVSDSDCIASNIGSLVHNKYGRI